MINIEKLFELEKSVDAALIISQKNRLYFTGFSSSFGYLIITPTKQVFITDFRYVEMAESLVEKGIEVLCGMGAELDKMLVLELKKAGVRNIGIEDNELTYNEYLEYKDKLSEFNISGIGQTINNIRQIKTDEEIEIIAVAQQITDKAFSKILNIIKPEMTEQDLCVELEYLLHKNGADGLAFETIIASGTNTSKPHAHPTNKKIKNGDAITMDFGARYKGYCSDMTRTVFLGKPSEQMRNIYNIVLMAQNNVLKNIKAGMTGKEVDAFAREIINANGFEGHFNHGLGHSLGLDIHESPRLSLSDNSIILPNMIETVEPGIYVSGLGGVRIEDLVVIKQDCIRNLTNSEKNIIIL